MNIVEIFKENYTLLRQAFYAYYKTPMLLKTFDIQSVTIPVLTQAHKITMPITNQSFKLNKQPLTIASWKLDMQNEKHPRQRAKLIKVTLDGAPKLLSQHNMQVTNPRLLPTSSSNKTMNQSKQAQEIETFAYGSVEQTGRSLNSVKFENIFTKLDELGVT